jgi:poly(A) polymerase/tRNA nucleotidyltransferase (CCA-adding enzyme)
MRIPAPVRELGEIFRNGGYECHLVGGAVRDLILGRPLTDFDIATNALPEQVSRLFRRVIPTGIKHGTVTVLFKDERFEVTTYRADGTYTDGRRPDSVTFSSTIDGDLARRDFTINGIACDLASGRVLDPHGGREDLKRRVIRAIGDPDERFHEDGLRPVRACRFAAQLGFTMEAATKAAIPRAIEKVRLVSPERVRDELVRIVQSANVVAGFQLLSETGLLAAIVPELEQGRGVEQRERHCFDVFVHSLHTCAAADPTDLGLRLAALLHDVGKPATLTLGENGEPRFHDHERVSAEMSREILRRLRLPGALVERVCHLVRHHMFNYGPDWKDSAVRRLVARVGREQIRDLLRLRRADQIGRCNRDEPMESLLELDRRIDRLLAADSALTLSDLAVDGTVLMRELALPRGPVVGVLLSRLLEAVIEDPAQNERSRLLEIARNFYDQRLRGPVRDDAGAGSSAS